MLNLKWTYLMDTEITVLLTPSTLFPFVFLRTLHVHKICVTHRISNSQNKRTGQIPFTSFCGGPVSVDFYFKTMIGSKKYNHNILSSMKSTLILTFRIINLQIYRTNLHLLSTDANPDGKGCPTASKLVKESEDVNVVKRLLF